MSKSARPPSPNIKPRHHPVLCGGYTRLELEVVQQLKAKDLHKCLTHCQNANLNERRAGLCNLLIYMRRSDTEMTEGDVQQVRETLRRFFPERSSKLYRVFLEVLHDFIQLYCEQLETWIEVVLRRLMDRLGSELLASLQSLIKRTLSSLQHCYTPGFLLRLVARVISRNDSFTHRSQLASLDYLGELLPLLQPEDFFEQSDLEACMKALATYLSTTNAPTRIKTQDILSVLFDLNPTTFNLFLSRLPVKLEDSLTRSIRRHWAKVIENEHLSPRKTFRAPPDEELRGLVQSNRELSKQRSLTDLMHFPAGSDEQLHSSNEDFLSQSCSMHGFSKKRSHSPLALTLALQHPCDTQSPLAAISLSPYIPPARTSEVLPPIPTSSPPEIPNSLSLSPDRQNILPSNIPASLYPNIPDSLPPAIPTSLPPDIPDSLPPDISTSLLPDISTSLPPNIPDSLPHAIPDSQPPAIPNSQPPDIATSLPPDIATSLPPDIATSLPPDISTSLPPDISTSLPPNIPDSLPHAIPDSQPPAIPDSQPPNISTSLPPDIATSLPPNISTSLPPGIATSLPPDIATSLPPDIATSLPPDIATSLPPGIATSLLPDIATSLPPDIATSLPPDIATSLPPDIATSLPPNILTSPQPETKPSPADIATSDLSRAVTEAEVASHSPIPVTTALPSQTSHNVATATSRPKKQAHTPSRIPVSIRTCPRLSGSERSRIFKLTLERESKRCVSLSPALVATFYKPSSLYSPSDSSLLSSRSTTESLRTYGNTPSKIPRYVCGRYSNTPHIPESTSRNENEGKSGRDTPLAELTVSSPNGSADVQPSTADGRKPRRSRMCLDFGEGNSVLRNSPGELPRNDLETNLQLKDERIKSSSDQTLIETDNAVATDVSPSKSMHSTSLGSSLHLIPSESVEDDSSAQMHSQSCHELRTESSVSLESEGELRLSSPSHSLKQLLGSFLSAEDLEMKVQAMNELRELLLTPALLPPRIDTLFPTLSKVVTEVISFSAQLPDRTQIVSMHTLYLLSQLAANTVCEHSERLAKFFLTAHAGASHLARNKLESLFLIFAQVLDTSVVIGITTDDLQNVTINYLTPLKLLSKLIPHTSAHVLSTHLHKLAPALVNAYTERAAIQNAALPCLVGLYNCLDPQMDAYLKGLSPAQEKLLLMYVKSSCKKRES